MFVYYYNTVKIAHSAIFVSVRRLKYSKLKKTILSPICNISVGYLFTLTLVIIISQEK